MSGLSPPNVAPPLALRVADDVEGASNSLIPECAAPIALCGRSALCGPWRTRAEVGKIQWPTCLRLTPVIAIRVPDDARIESGYRPFVWPTAIE